MGKVGLPALLKTMIEQDASDLHITVGVPPEFRIQGKMVKAKVDTLTHQDTKELCYSVLTDSQKIEFEKAQELDFSFGIKDVARFRGNLFFQRGGVAGVFRWIPIHIPDFDKLNLPIILKKVIKRPNGLVLVTGPTGSGKSTTLASLLDILNREDPDFVLVGELRDMETIEMALNMAETGHMVFATLHTNGAIQSINRIINAFPPHQQTQIRHALSFTLQAIVSQTLIPKSFTPGRILACELLIPTMAIRNLIREDKIHQIYSSMQTGQDETFMLTMNQSLVALVRGGILSKTDAIENSTMPEELAKALGNAADRR